ncbi:aldo/keto reductase [Nitratireductor luteus]|uniref:aldo/keto reductase n=1 Tax=Nitratireductor luteus TaxID=2976980 RepID=UPI00223F4292|nr:aldo/keto reductase [Nitratireductor luteus]
MKFIEANGARIPALGLGTWTLAGATCADLVLSAIETGYTHIDTAAMYENEEDVGRAVERSGARRADLFVTTKVWWTDLAPDDLLRSARHSLERLKLEYLDLLLIHWPNPAVPLQDSIEALNEAQRSGLTRHIGVSNFPTDLLARAVACSAAPLVANQVEHHPYIDQTKVHQACRSHGMAMISYCPLARGGGLFGEPAVVAAAKAHARSPAQIVLRWHVQQDGIGVIPRTTKAERLAENAAVFDFALSEGEMASISALTRANQRICDYGFSPRWDAP